jgi:hypothetical protein
MAVKIINKANTPEGYFAKFFPREVAAMQNVSHPNVVGLFR